MAAAVKEVVWQNEFQAKQFSGVYR